MIEGWDPPVPVPNVYLMARIAAATALIGNASVDGTSDGEGRTELDSHANMCVLGKHCFLLSELSTARTVSVGAFAESAGGLDEVPIVDAMLAYDCEQTNQVYLLVLRNVFYIESMDDNLIQPFILQAQDVDFEESEVGFGYRMSEAAATAMKPFSQELPGARRTTCRLDQSCTKSSV